MSYREISPGCVICDDNKKIKKDIKMVERVKRSARNSAGRANMKNDGMG